METIDRHKVPHEYVEIELTESEDFRDYIVMAKLIDALKAEGISTSIDDFGTGYSNFSCMMQLPFQFIKLDSSLIRTANRMPQTSDFVQTLTKLSHDMGMQVIAEGVETQEDAALLEQQGIDRIQGYVFAKPMPAAELLEFYHSNPV